MPLEVERYDCGCIPCLKLPDGMRAGAKFNEDTLINMSSIELRDDDVIIACYEYSGHFPVWENVRMLLTGLHHQEDQSAPELKFQRRMESNSIADLNCMQSPRVLITHQFFHKMPKALLNGEVKAKVIFLYRNPKDTAISAFYHMSRESFEGIPLVEGALTFFLEMFYKGLVPNNHIMDYWTSWVEGLRISNLNVYILRFEDLILNPFVERHRLGEFLEQETSREFTRKVIDTTTATSRPGRRYSVQFLNMFFTGEVGDWRYHLTVAQNEEFDHFLDRNPIVKSDFFKFIFRAEDFAKEQQEEDEESRTRSIEFCVHEEESNVASSLDDLSE